MSDKSSIEWTATVHPDGTVTPGATWNPVRGCTKVSPGCANCYAETFAERFRGVPGHPYEQGFDLRLVPEKLEEPLRWRKPKRIFVNSMSDLFHEDVPDAFIDRVFAVMALAPQHTFQVLTKRPARMLAYLGDGSGPGVIRWIGPPGTYDRIKSAAEGLLHNKPGRRVGWPLPNVWPGVSVENQHFADERIPLLLQTPAAVRFISGEPLLGPVLLDNGESSWLTCTPENQARNHHSEDCCLTFYENRDRHFHGIDWVIVGGESGPGARPLEVAWARSIVAQCKAAGIACFVKQLGSDPSDAAAARDDMGARDVWPAGWMPTIDGRRVWRPDLADRKGGDPREWPSDLRVRQFPETRA